MTDFSLLEQRNGLPPGTLAAMMQQESGGNPNAISPKGAVGSFQFMPQTAQQYGIDPRNPDQSAQAAAQMMGQLRQKYNGDMPSALAGYNWGQGNVDRQGLQNAPPETQNYIQKIMGGIGNALVPPANAAEVGGLPSGFVLDGQQAAPAGLPSGFVLDQKEAPGAFTTATNAAVNAASFGLAPTIAGLAGGAANLVKGKGFGEGYTQAKQDYNAEQTAGEQAHPIASGIGTTAGIIGGAPAGVTKAAVETALPASNVLVQGARARDAEELAAAATDMKQAASPFYKASKGTGEFLPGEASATGATIKDESAIKIAGDVDKAVASSGLNNARLHGDTLSVLEDLKTAASGGNMTVEGLDQYRQLFRDVIDKNTDAIRGLNPDAFKAQMAIKSLDKAIDSLALKDLSAGDLSAVQSLQQGRAQYAQYARFSNVANVIKQAGGDPNKLKAGLQRFVNKDSNLRGFSEQEKTALREAAANTTTEKLLKMFGKFGIDLGTSLTPGNTALPALTGFVGGSPLVAAGTVARQAQKYLARGKAEKALQLIQHRQ